MFIFNVSNVIDLITNSSSELFILSGDNKKEVEDLISSVYPNYLSEYEEVKSLSDLDNSELNTYLSYEYHDWNNKLILSDVFNIDPKILYENYDEIDNSKYWYGHLSKDGMNQIREKLPKDMFFLFSIDENPDYDKQEDLMNIATRYHLG